MACRSTNIRSARALYQLLKRALDKPDTAPASLVRACSSQRTFAALEISAEEIAGMSLTTLIAAADAGIREGGWERLDEMRRALKSVTKGQKKSYSRVERERLTRNRLAHKDTLLEELRRGHFKLEASYFDLLRIVERWGRQNPDVAEALRRHRVSFSVKRLQAAGTQSNDRTRKE